MTRKERHHYSGRYSAWYAFHHKPTNASHSQTAPPPPATSTTHHASDGPSTAKLKNGKNYVCVYDDLFDPDKENETPIQPHAPLRTSQHR